MNKSAFLQLIQQANSISDHQTEELEKVAATFPYCQTAHLLLAKSAYDKGSMLSTQRLRRASAYATNRQLLKRIIYTSPVAVPEFDETAVEEQPVTETHEKQAPALLSVTPEDTDVKTTDTEILNQESTPVEAALEAVDNDTLSEAVELEESDNIEEAEAEFVAFEAEEEVEESTVEVDPEPAEELPPVQDILEQPMEKLDSELALLLTIKSLSPSFTDLLAQKPDVEPEQKAPVSAFTPLAPEAQVPEVLDQQGPPEPEDVKPSPADELADMISAEVAAAAKSYFDLEEPAEDTSAQGHAAPTLANEPDEAEVKYAFDEIDQMYQQDVLGYWMSSSRMGEVLQLKEENELTRPKPAAFHPELILEYSKTHDLTREEDPALTPLHEQLGIIDQFLKLNPRLKAMNNVKLKPEPQEDLSLKSTKIKRGIASESLANIFLKQGKVKKAIKIYEQLILKSPEKKSYFAEQIEKLQNLS